jgi:lipopolysaccharide assembly outer membrane protein LptD (OstA)
MDSMSNRWFSRILVLTHEDHEKGVGIRFSEWLKKSPSILPALLNISPVKLMTHARACSLGIALLTLFAFSARAQVSSDTLRLQTALPDATVRPRPSDVDTVVVYSAKDSITYSMRTRFMHLYGASELSYRTIGLKADRIDVNWDTATMNAEGTPDPGDTTGTKFIGLPVLTDAGEKYDGARIGYNFRTKKGKITLANTEIERGYYHGEKIKKVETDVLFVEDGRYTTCDLDHPHFYFYSPKMKVILRDKVIAEPIFFYIADVPVFALPFGVFPNKAGRRSGIIAPAYGYDARRGRYLSHFGYYWAVSEYMDFASTFDWYTRGGWLNRSLLRYALRYEFSGSLNASVSRTHDGEPGDPDRSEQRDYNVNLFHNQQLDPTTRLDVNFTFATGSYFRNFSSNLDEILRQNIVSTATLSKSWEGTNRNIGISLYRDQNLITGAIEERLPSVSFTQGQVYPFRRATATRGLGGTTNVEMSWYEMLGVSYSAQGQSNRSKTVDIVKSRVDPSQDSLRIEQRKERMGVNHQATVSAAPKAGYFTISPFLSYNEKWYTKRIERDSTGTRDVNGFRAVRTFNTGISASTRFYGIMQPQVFGITGVRHTVTPGLSLNYQPDFSDPRFGYYGTYTDTSGREVKYSFFEREVYGGAPQGRQQSLNFSVGNVFEMKYQPADTAQKEEKIQLLNASAGLSYNFAADSLRLSPLSISYRTDIGRNLNVSASTTHNFYVFDEATGRRVNRFILKEKKYLADLTNISLSFSTSLSGQKKASTIAEGIPAEVRQEQERASTFPGFRAPPSAYSGLFGDESADFSIPWNLYLSYTFSQSQADPRVKVRSSSANANLSFNLTEAWRFSASGSYDFVRKEFAAPSVSIYRDLHCWEMSFSWFPIGFYNGYRLELRVKAPQLQDIKITKQASERGTYF